MLSRSAKHLYWLARYVERAENIARMIDVNLELILDFPDDHSLNWKPLIDTLDINDLFENKYKKYKKSCHPCSLYYFVCDFLDGFHVYVF